MTLYLFNFFFFNDTATTEIYTLSLHDALPISIKFFFSKNQKNYFKIFCRKKNFFLPKEKIFFQKSIFVKKFFPLRSEEHTSELQSLRHLVCRLLLEKKKITYTE